MPDKRSQKLVNQTFEHDGHTVLFNEVPREYYGSDNEYANERRRYHVSVDGQFCAVVRKPYGFGKQALIIEKLSPPHSGIYGDRTLIRNYHNSTNFDLIDIVPLILRHRLSPKGDYEALPTEEESRAAHDDRAKKDREYKEENERRYARERIERKAFLQETIETREAEIEGLEELAAGPGLTNSQISALVTALTLLKSDLRKHRDELGRMMEWDERNG